ncbi:MAG: sulfatase-like hydrolase/transferase [Sediminibacterium sp.]
MFDIKKASLIIIILPYIGFNFQELIQSPFYSITNLFFLLATLFLIEFFYKLIKIKFKKYGTFITIIVTSFVMVFFYGYYFVNPIYNFFNINWAIEIRGLATILLLLIISICLQYFIVLKKKANYKNLNIFLLVFGIVTLIAAHNPNSKNKINYNSFHNAYKSIHLQDSVVKPVLLIVLDEYNSPDNLYTLFKDSNLYQFSTQLKKDGWEVRNNSYSYETSTIHSVASILNYNLSLNKDYKESDLAAIEYYYLKHSLLIDSLYKKDVKFINFGIFDINNNEKKYSLYIYPESFTENFLIYTCYMFAKRQLIKFNDERLNNKDELIMEHNKFILNNITSEIDKADAKTFIKIHLYMPHAPLYYEPEFKKLELKNVNDYLQYWNFTNKKLTEMLSKLNKYRIILTGDHGLRGMPTNPHSTFTAFYGFDSTALKSIHSVQDLGSLINGSF